MRSTLVRLSVGITLLVSFSAISLPAQNLLLNPGFEIPATGVVPPAWVTYTNHCLGGNSAAADWYIYVNTCGTDIKTQLLPSTLPNGGKYMLHLITNGGENGIVQANTFNLPKTLSSIWVFINSGCVGFGTGNGGITHETDEMSCLIGQWIHLQVPNGVSPANEVLIYSLPHPFNGTTGADYYLDNGAVVP
jgi:hypothetical protein